MEVLPANLSYYDEGIHEEIEAGRRAKAEGGASASSRSMLTFVS